MSIEQVKKKFLSEGISVTNNWLSDMFDRGIFDYSEIKNQFLNLNISLTTENSSDFEFDCTEHKTTTMKHVVQVDEVVDISLCQYDRIVFKQSSKGTMKFLLNLGGQHFVGIEKERFDSNDINVFMQPGAKILIDEGSDIYFGCLFMSPRNVHFLGGRAGDLIDKRKHIYCDSSVSGITKIKDEEAEEKKENVEENDSCVASSEYEGEESKSVELLPPPSPNSNVKAIFDLVVARDPVGTEYLVNAKFSKINEIYFCNDALEIIGEISDGDISLKVKIDQDVILGVMKLNSALDWVNLDELTEFKKRIACIEYLRSLSNPLKVKSFGLSDNEIRYMLYI